MLEDTIKKLQDQQTDYWPNNDVIQELGTRSLVMIVSPSGVGKSALIQGLARRDIRFAGVSDITSREPRADDEPGLFRYAPEGTPAFDKLLRDITKRNLVQYQIFPTTGKIYGTEIMDYPGEHNCMAILGSAVAKMRSLPFLRTRTFSLVCEPKHWQARFQKRYPDPDDPELTKRLEEARLNLEWSLGDSETVWVRNNDGELDAAVNQISRYVIDREEPGQAEQTKLRTLATHMLESIK